MKQLRRIAALACGLALVAMAAFGENIVKDGQKVNAVTGTTIAGITVAADTIGKVLRLTSVGNLMVNEQAPISGQGAVVNFGLSSTILVARSFKVGNPVSFGSAGVGGVGFNSGNIQVSIAAADSDSAAFLVYLYAKQSSVAGDGLDFHIPSRVIGATIVDSAATAASTTNPISRILSGWYIGANQMYYTSDVAASCPRVESAYPKMVLATGAPSSNWPTAIVKTQQYTFAIPTWVRAAYLNVVVVNLCNSSRTITVDAYLHGN